MGPRLEEVLAQGKYFKNDSEFGENIWTITKRDKEEEKVYTYDEAINLTGNGCYNIGLLVSLLSAIQAMALDMFGFAVVVSACACDLRLEHWQTSTLLSVPLLGSILMAYPWGYISDTQGRKKSLSIALWSSFVLASLSAFSPNWIVLAILKFFASSLSSGAQSMGYTLLGESCSGRTKGAYMIIVSSSLLLAFGVFTAHGYVILNLEFAFDWSYIIFKPWRLLILTMAMTLGFSAFLVSFYYESPKFLVNAGKTEEALNILKKIKKRNGEDDVYPVKKIILTEATCIRHKDVSLIVSLWKQTVPLFLSPMVKNTLVLFYITAVIYSMNNGFFLWIPIILGSFFEDVPMVGKNATEGFCDLISLRSSNTNTECIGVVNVETLITSFVHGVVFTVINLGLSGFAHRKKTILIVLFLICSACCSAMLLVSEKIFSIILFFGFMLNSLCMGIVFSYFVELFPTSYRGMVSCLGVMVARSSAVIGVNLIGSFIFSHCTISLYIWGSYTFSGALVSLLLPPDVP